MASEASSVKRSQKEWAVPHNSKTSPHLTLYNGLTRQKEKFVPVDGRKVKWYSCGPTVYDSSHMGHARSFLSLDILRRVITNYFGYDVQFIMNITDIDDKIIKRARQRHLLEEYLGKGNEKPSVEKVCKDVIDAVKYYTVKFESEIDPDKRTMQEKMIAKVQLSANNLETALGKKDTVEIETAKGSLLNNARDILSDWLDAQFGKDIVDHTVFDKLAKTYETEFLEDMARLHVLPADVLTRVSEYVPEIVRYVEKIIGNGYGYATKDGSVYFDTKTFEENPKHFYAKLVPEAFGDSETLEKNLREGEGELSMGADQLLMKKNPSDFALWKSSKAGEPFWNSPWGNGRPGWHIECSAMSSEVCGSKLDIHAGGFDLKFPHHDNEIAQVEAHYDDPHWVNYFLHCGTLRISGMKMSKSLKNFITIRDALKQYTARQLRILFLMHNWSDVLDYSNSTMERALQFERLANDFFLLVKDYLRRSYKPEVPQGYEKFKQRELDLLDELSRIKEGVHNALCDSVDTRTAIEKVRELISLGNVYIMEREKESGAPNVMLLHKIANYITSLLKMFGAIPEYQDIGFPMESAGGDVAGVSAESLLMPYLNALAVFREQVRNIAKEHKVVKILEECDRLRDDILPELGVKLEDRTSQTCVKLVDRDTLMREQQQKKEIEAQKLAEKEAKAAEKARKEAEAEASKRIDPKEMFKDGEEAAKYSKWDEDGIPTHSADGEEITKSARKKLVKQWEAQKKKFEQATKN